MKGETDAMRRGERVVSAIRLLNVYRQFAERMMALGMPRAQVDLVIRERFANWPGGFFGALLRERLREEMKVDEIARWLN